MPRPRKGCTGKAKHQSPEHAQRQINFCHHPDPSLLSIYECRHCRSFHVGHRKLHHALPSGRVLAFLVSQALVEDRDLRSHKTDCTGR